MSKKTKRQVSSSKVQEAVQVTSKAAASTPSSNSGEFNPDYSYVKTDLKKIGIMAGSFFAILVILSFFLR
jgi:hypothetical protein